MQMLDSILTLIVIFIPSTRSSNGFIMTRRMRVHPQNRTRPAAA